MSVADAVSHAPTYWSKASAPSNIFCMLVTFDVSQEPMSQRPLQYPLARLSFRNMMFHGDAIFNALEVIPAFKRPESPSLATSSVYVKRGPTPAP